MQIRFYSFEIEWSTPMVDDMVSKLFRRSVLYLFTLTQSFNCSRRRRSLRPSRSCSIIRMTRTCSQEFEDKAVGSVLLLQDYWGWWPIKQGCLLTSGLNIQGLPLDRTFFQIIGHVCTGSPFEDFQAISGNARPDFSTASYSDWLCPRALQVSSAQNRC